MRADRPSTLRFYLTILRRRWLPMLVVFVIPIVIVLVITLQATKQYAGTALVVINRQSLADELTGTTDPSAASSDFLNIINTYADAAHSTQVADRVAAAVPAAHLTGAELLSKSTVTASQDADVVQFTVRDQDPAMALTLAREFASQFVTYEEGLSVSAIDAALRQVDARLAGARRSHDKTLASSLASRDQQLRTLATLQTANNSVVAPTTTASVASPRRTVDIALGVIGGLVLAVLIAALLEALDTRVRSSGDVQEILGTPMLGRLEPPPSAYRDRVVSLRDPADGHAEGFRMLRTSLDLQTLGSDAKVVMVTSSVDEEGKSLTLANLAVTTARAGRNVVLVDLDLRRPTQDKLFETDGRAPGVTDVLLGTVSLDDALVEIALSGPAVSQNGAQASVDGAAVKAVNGDRPAGAGSLRLLRAGVPAPDPGELVASERTESVIAALRDRADVVYVDCPPILVAGDAMAISRFCDSLVLVTRIPRVRRPMLDEVTRTLRTSPTPIAGFVVTGETRAVRPAYT
jgi:polysaccharide biosynthesis transport protein